MGFESYHDWREAVDRKTAEVWAQNQGAMVFDPVNPEMGVSHVLEVTEETAAAGEAYVRAVRAVMDFLWSGGPSLIEASKRLYVITRHVSPQHIGFMNQSDVAVMLNETRAATQAREERVWEKFLEGQGFLGTRTRLKKSNGARAVYAEKAKGNSNRVGGKKAKRKFSKLRNATKPTNQHEHQQ